MDLIVGGPPGMARRLRSFLRMSLASAVEGTIQDSASMTGKLTASQNRNVNHAGNLKQFRFIS